MTNVIKEPISSVLSVFELFPYRKRGATILSCVESKSFSNCFRAFNNLQISKYTHKPTYTEAKMSFAQKYVFQYFN